MAVNGSNVAQDVQRFDDDEQGHAKGRSHPLYDLYHAAWEEEQVKLQSLVQDCDAEHWMIGASKGDVPLKYVAGVDISFVKEDPDIACAAVVVIEFPSLELKYEDYRMVKLELPYISGFLAFRECPHLVAIIDELRSKRPDLTPQVIMVDGMGVLHPRGLGLASHLGVLTGIPTIGVGKTFLNVDGLRKDEIVRESRKHLHAAGDAWQLQGVSGRILGAAFRSTNDAPNPVFVSRGHLIRLETALDIVRACCRYRVPEPIRLADKGSREYLRLNYHPPATAAAEQPAAPPEPHRATAMRLHGDKWVIALQRLTKEVADAGRVAVHFCLDNSGSMGSNSRNAQLCFSELVSLANEPCSFTVFSETATTLSTSIRSPKELCDIPLPPQGMTNISDGIACMLKAVQASTKDRSTHHIMVLLTDGDHNKGPIPSKRLPELATQFRRDQPGAKASFLVIGVSGASRTDLGMLAKTAFETIPLPGMRSIYFCQQPNEMQAVLDELKFGLLNQIGGKVVQVTCPQIQLHPSLTAPPAAECDVFVTPTLSRAGAALFAVVPDASSLAALCVDGLSTPATEVDYDEEVVMQAFDVFLRLLRQQKVAAGNISAEVAALEPWLRALEMKLTNTAEPVSLANRTPQERLRLHKQMTTNLHKVRAVRNEVAAIVAMQADSSAAQAAFLTGQTGKYAAKALARAGPDSHTTSAILEDLQRRLPKLRLALRKDAWLLLKRMPDPAAVLKEAGDNAVLVQQLLDLPDLADEVVTEELARFLDEGLIPLLQGLQPLPHSFLSLRSQWEHLTEWFAAAEDDFGLMLSNEYELLMSLGVVGYPITLTRCNATQMDPYQCTVSAFMPTPCDSASLYFALKSGVEIRSPEGAPLEDMLVSIDPMCPNASAVVYWSKLVDTLYSVTLCRDLFMAAPAQRLALHAQSFVTAAEQAHHEVFAERALQILYSVRRHWGKQGGESFRALATRLLNWETITEADDVSHPVQLLLAMAALDWGDWPTLQTPALATLFNEILSRRARTVLRGMASDQSEHATLTVAHRHMRQVFGIEEASCPEPTPPEEKEPALETVRDACACDFQVDQAFVSEFLEHKLRPTMTTVRFIQALQAYLADHGGWPALMAALERAEAAPALAAITAAMRQPQPATVLEMLEVEAGRHGAVGAAMVLQAFLHHVSGRRSDLGDPSDGETLRELVKDLRMDVYMSRLRVKNAARQAIIGSLVYEQAMDADEDDFALLVGAHAHGLMRREFWALARAAKRLSGRKREIFVEKCNTPFQFGKAFKKL